GEKVDCRADLYACGVLLYEMATGRVPFTADSPMPILVAHVSEQPLPPRSVNPNVDPRLETIILKALAKDPDARYQSARALRADLRALVGQMSSPFGFMPPGRDIVVETAPEPVTRRRDSTAFAVTPPSSGVRVAAPRKRSDPSSREPLPLSDSAAEFVV